MTLIAAAAEPQQQGKIQSANDSTLNLETQLAEARVQLAKLELERAAAANKRMPGIYSPIAVELLQRNVIVAEARLGELSRTGDFNAHAIHLRELEGAQKIAELRLKNAQRLRQGLPASGDASQVESLRLRTEIARLELARARDPEHVATPLDHLQWQLEQLRHEMLEVTLRLEELSHRN